MGAKFLFVIATAIAWCGSAIADEYFNRTRVDTTVPAHCAEPDLRHFPLMQRQVIFGIQGAVRAGFSHEYPISRSDAQYLWMVFLGNHQNEPGILAEIRRNKLEEPFETLKLAQRSMNFTFEKEGDVLEALAISKLSREYPSPHYFITGGIEYREKKNGDTIGELDLLVGERDTCRIIAIGETKLGVKQLSHAREQLRRFLNFLKFKCKESGNCSNGRHN